MQGVMRHRRLAALQRAPRKSTDERHQKNKGGEGGIERRKKRAQPWTSTCEKESGVVWNFTWFALEVKRHGDLSFVSDVWALSNIIVFLCLKDP